MEISLEVPSEVQALYEEKISKFQDAIYNCSELKSLVRSQGCDGDNDYDDRYWSAIFHRTTVEPTLGKKTRLSFGFGSPKYSIIFLYDHTLNKSLVIRGDFDSKDKNSYKNICQFAMFFESRLALVAQFTDRLMIYQINPETLSIQQTIDSDNSQENHNRRFRRQIERVVFDSNGLDYLAYLDYDGDASLIKFDWEAGKIMMDNLPGYMTHFGLLHCLFVKELGKYPIVILGISGKQTSDPDMGYSVFLQNGSGEEISLHNYKNEFFQSSTPSRFVFYDQTDEYISIEVYTSNDILLTKTTVPTNMDGARHK